jgi:hypothetical protein
MATCPKFTRMANYSCECGEASHIFLKNGRWRVLASLASTCKTAWRMLRVWRVHATRLGECWRVWRVRAKRFGECRRVWRVLAKRLGECGEFGESRVFLKTAVLASTRTRQKRRIFGEYSNLPNSPASSHCLNKIQMSQLLMGEIA